MKPWIRVRPRFECWPRAKPGADISKAAAPMFQALETNFPADGAIGRRTAAVYRSLGTIDPGRMMHPSRRTKSDGANRGTFGRSRGSARWRRIADASIALQADWDRIPESIRASPMAIWKPRLFSGIISVRRRAALIDEGRRRLGSPALFAYEAGAIRENQRNYERAILEYAPRRDRESSDRTRSADCCSGAAAGAIARRSNC